MLKVLIISKRRRGMLFYFPEISSNCENFMLKALAMNNMEFISILPSWLPDNVLDAPCV